MIEPLERRVLLLDDLVELVRAERRDGRAIAGLVRHAQAAPISKGSETKRWGSTIVSIWMMWIAEGSSTRLVFAPGTPEGCRSICRRRVESQ
jgi:hypothetical protein